MTDHTGTTHWLTDHKCPQCNSRASTYGRGEVLTCTNARCWYRWVVMIKKGADADPR